MSRDSNTWQYWAEWFVITAFYIGIFVAIAWRFRKQLSPTQKPPQPESQLVESPPEKTQLQFAEEIIERISEVVLDFDNKMRGIPQAHIAADLVTEMTSGLVNLRTELRHELCNHVWVSLKNPVIQSGSMCLTCGKLTDLDPEHAVQQFPRSTIHP